MSVYVNITKRERVWINEDGNETTPPNPIGVSNIGMAEPTTDSKNEGRTAGVSPSA